jgi:hypothetical protein
MAQQSHDSSVSTALGYRLDDRGSRVRFPARAGNFSLHHCVQNGSGAHPASYPWVSGALSLEIKWLGCEAHHSPPSSAKVKEGVELYLHSPNTPSRCGAWLKKAQGQLFYMAQLTVTNLIFSRPMFLDWWTMKRFQVGRRWEYKTYKILDNTKDTFMTGSCAISNFHSTHTTRDHWCQKWALKSLCT